MGWKALWKKEGTQVAYFDTLYEDFVDALDECTDIVTFNGKFDCHWLRRLGIRQFQSKRHWDCQLGEYILSNQQWQYPDLNTSLKNRGGPLKLDVVKTEYWDKGIDTDKIPRDILAQYQAQDVDSTEWLYKEQAKIFALRPKTFRLFRLTCDDMLVLEEMEANGLKLDVELCLKRQKETEAKIEELQQTLDVYGNGAPINWDSNDHLSAILFGGRIGFTTKVPDGYFKTGLKAGQPKFKNEEQYAWFPRLFEPKKDWEVKKTKPLSDEELKQSNSVRLYFTNDEVLSSIPNKHPIITVLKDRAKWVKILEYYTKLPKQIEYMGWTECMLHGQFNQVVTKTGRSSSSKPNMQNMAGLIQDILISRY